MSVMLSAASCLDWAAQLTGQHDLARLVSPRRRAGSIASRRFFCLPHGRNARQYNDPHARGVFFGIRSDTDAVDLAVAVLEGVALAFADGLDVLLEKGGRSMRSVSQAVVLVCRTGANCSPRRSIVH